MKKKLSIMLSVAALAISLVACSAAPAAGSASSEPQSGGSGSSSSATDENTIKLFNGTMPIPENFDNFIVLNTTLLDHFVALDVIPTAASMSTPPTAESTPTSAAYYNDGFARIYKDGVLDDVERLTTNVDDMLEKLVDLDPSFIVTSDSHEKYLDKLEAIAPTYLIPSDVLNAEGKSDWREVHKLVGKLAGKEAEAEANVAEYADLVADYKTQIADKIDGKTALVLQLNQKGFKIRSTDDQPQVYKELGFVSPTGHTDNLSSAGVTNEDGSYPVEQLIAMNPDFIFIHTQSVDDYKALAGTPIWDNIQAIKDGNIYEVNHYVWVQNDGILSNTLKLHDTANFILTGEQVASYTVF